MSALSDKDVVDMAERCIEEIQMLRAEIRHLAPKASGYDAITQILGLLPRPNQGASEDVVWRLQNQIRQIKAALVTPAKPPTS